MKKLFILLPCLLAQAMVFAQTNLNVLPIEGRNELFHTFLMEKGAELWDARRDSVQASLQSVESLMARQAQLREDYIMLLGDLPEKTPLNGEVVGTIQKDGYRIERVHYQSRPNFHVTGHFYIPDSGEAGPFPTVLVLCGHYPVGKSISLYQKLGTLFATNGIAAFVVDPFSQGERNQIQDPDTGELLFAGESGTSAHSRLDVGAVLTGTSVVAQALWDNHRAMDYIYSRMDIVDTTRVGCTGSSGGGSQATYLSAFDERIKVAAINSFLMNEETLFNTIGPQTASQNLSYEGAYLIDHPDYITMFAPKPFMILAATQDFFEIGATMDTYAEAQQVYTLLGVPDQIGYFEEDAQHGYLKPRREEAVRWFRKWFYDDDTAISEPFTLEVLSIAELSVTSTMQVTTEFADEKTLTDLNVELANDLATNREDFWTQNTADSCLNKVSELIRLEDYDAVVVEETESFDRGDYTLTKLKISSGDDVPVTGLLMVPDGLTEPAPAVLYVDGRGKSLDADAGGILEKIFVDSGKVVLTIDVRGFGETADNAAKNETKHGNKEHRNAVIGAYVGKTLIGQRVGDIMKTLDVIAARSEVNPDDITLVGIDRAGPVVLHTAALDDRVKATVIRQSFESWLPMVGNPTELHNMTHVVPFALKYYDLPDLAGTLPEGSLEYFDDPYMVISSTSELEGDHKSGRLEQNFPNPAKGQTIIPYELKEVGNVQIKIFDQQGIEQTTIMQGQQIPGRHQATLNGYQLTAGQYYYQLWVNGNPVGSKAMILLSK